MIVFGWAAIGVTFTLLVVWGLCCASADGDILASHDDEYGDDLEQVAHIEEYRARRERLNAWARSVVDEEPVA
jgi:hypothetical protein